jgi:hypothetical protein
MMGRPSRWAAGFNSGNPPGSGNKMSLSYVLLFLTFFDTLF